MKPSICASPSLLYLVLSILLSPIESQQDCQYRCPDSSLVPAGEKTPLVPLQAPRLPYSNGCSVPSFLQLPDFDFSVCCDGHDACYMTCGVPKEHCEKDFQVCMSALCGDKYDGEQKTECEQTANMLVMGVRMFGCPAFVASQESACECVSKEEVLGKTRDALTRFYSRFNPDKTQEEIDVFVEKNKGKKTPGMWRTLFKKYPQSITIISRDGEKQTESGLGEEL